MVMVDNEWLKPPQDFKQFIPEYMLGLVSLQHKRATQLLDFYSRLYDYSVYTEQQQRRNTIPDNWIWMSSGMEDEEVDRLNPDFRTTNEITTHKIMRDGKLVSALWVKVLPKDHDGRYNLRAIDKSEMVFVAPPEYFLEDDAPELDVDSINWNDLTLSDQSRFTLVALEDVEITRPEKPNSSPKSIKRYILVPLKYREQYFSTLGRPDGKIFHTQRKVEIRGNAEMYLQFIRAI